MWALRINGWYASLTVVMVAMGMMLSIQWSAPPASSAVSGDGTRRDVSSATVQKLEEQQRALKTEVGRLQQEIKSYQDRASRGKDSISGLTEELERQKMIAGLLPLGGPGVKVILDDSTLQPLPGDDVSNYIVHDYELRDVVNFLWQAGAEAISLNDERIVATTSIYCVGSTIMVNSTRLSPPYEIRAIGDAGSLEALLNHPNTLRKLKASTAKYGVSLKIQKANEVQLPAYTGGYNVKYATLNSA